MKSLQRSAEMGAVHRFPLPDHAPLGWALVHRHPDERSLLFAVPADEMGMPGPADVVAPETGRAGALVLRCGLGTWVREQDLFRSRVVARVSSYFAARALERVRAVAFGGLPEAVDLRENEERDDYAEWEAEVARAGADLSVWSERRVLEAVSLEEWRAWTAQTSPRKATTNAARRELARAWARLVEPERASPAPMHRFPAKRSSAPPLRLAAEGAATDSRVALREARLRFGPIDARAQRPRPVVIGGSESLWLGASKKGLVPFWTNSSKDAPPECHASPPFGGPVAPVEWRRRPRSNVWRARSPIPWAEPNVVVLTIRTDPWHEILVED